VSYFSMTYPIARVLFSRQTFIDEKKNKEVCKSKPLWFLKTSFLTTPSKLKRSSQTSEARISRVSRIPLRFLSRISVCSPSREGFDSPTGPLTHYISTSGIRPSPTRYTYSGTHKRANSHAHAPIHAGKDTQG
jgi:hypothetical protein